MTKLLTKQELTKRTGDSGSTMFSTRTFSKILDAVNDFHKLGQSAKQKDILDKLNKLELLIKDWQKKPDQDKETIIEKKRQALGELQQQINKFVDELLNSHQPQPEASDDKLVAHTIAYKASLIPFKTKALEAPSTEIEFNVTLKTQSKIDNPFTEQLLRDSVTPYLNEVREEVAHIMRGTDEALQNGDFSQEECEALVRQMNGNFKHIIEDAELMARKLLKEKWEKLVEEDRSLREWKIAASVEISKGGFGAITGIASTIGTFGLSIVVDVIVILNDIRTTYENIRKLAIGEQKARDDLLDAMEDVQKKLTGEERDFWAKVGDFFGGSANSLEEELETYTSKLTGLRQETEKLAIELNELLDKQDDLQALAKEEKNADLATALEEIEKMTANSLDAIDRLNDTRNPGEALTKQGQQLLEFARKKEGKKEKVRDGISKCIDWAIWLKQALSPLDALIEYGSDSAGLAAKKLGDYNASKK